MSGFFVMIGLIFVAAAIRDASVRLHKAIAGKDYKPDVDIFGSGK